MKLVPLSLPRSSYVPSSFGLYCSACFVSLFVSILCTCCSHFFWYWYCRQILLPRPRRLWPRDPWAMQLKLQQTGEGAGESPAPWNWAHSAKGANPYRKACRSRGIKVAAPPLDSHCDGPVTYPGDTKILVKSSKGRSGQLKIYCI